MREENEQLQKTLKQMNLLLLGDDLEVVVSRVKDFGEDYNIIKLYRTRAGKTYIKDLKDGVTTKEAIEFIKIMILGRRISIER